MKKLLVAVVSSLVLLAGQVFAGGHGTRFGGTPSNTWKMTIVDRFSIGAATASVTIATGSSVHIHKVIVTSGATGSEIRLFNGYEFAGAATGPVFDADAIFEYPLDVVISSGLLFQSFGNAESYILWDWGIDKTTNSFINLTPEQIYPRNFAQ